MKDLTHIVIETERLKLISLHKDYVEEIFKEFNPEITTYMYSAPAKDISETHAYIDSQIPLMKSGKELPVVIINKTTGEFLGCSGAHKVDTMYPELGIWIKKAAHGHGYGKEAVTGMKKWIDNNINYEYIKYPVSRVNSPSRLIAESLGGIVKDEYKKINMSGNELDEVEYRIYPSKR